MRIGLVGVGRIGALHARTLRALDGVDQVVLADADRTRAELVARELELDVVAGPADLVRAGIDGLVVASATPSHAALLRQGVAAGVPIFCEKPVAATLQETIELVREMALTSVPTQVGFQRRFDLGYRRVAEAVAAGGLGWLHTIRANTHDENPPAAAYIPTSGGIFRDCSVHDFDIIRFVTGREVASVRATGGNKGETFFAEAGDVDTGAALLTLDDDTMAVVTATRYNGGGHDVRLEAMGSRGSMAVGLDRSLALRSAEPNAVDPAGPLHHSFMDRFNAAYSAELEAFVQVAQGSRPSPCTVADALAAFRVAEACEISRRESRAVALREVADA